MKKQLLFGLILIMGTSISLAQQSEKDKLSVDTNDKFVRYVDEFQKKFDPAYVFTHAVFSKDGKLALVDLTTGKATTPYKYSSFDEVRQGLIEGQEGMDQDVTLLSYDGEVIMDSFYGKVFDFHNDHAVVVKLDKDWDRRASGVPSLFEPSKGRYGMIDTKGNVVIDFDFTYLDPSLALNGWGRFSKSPYVGYDHWNDPNPFKGGTWGLINSKGEMLTDGRAPYDYIVFSSSHYKDHKNVHLAKKGDVYLFLDTTGQVVVDNISEQEINKWAKRMNRQYNKAFRGKK